MNPSDHTQICFVPNRVVQNPNMPDRDLFDGKFLGRKFTFNYALRCGDEDQIIGATEAILRQVGQ